MGALQLHAPSSRDGAGPEAFYLDENLGVLAPVDVATYDRQEGIVRRRDTFRRGDVDADGQVALSDAISLLNHLFDGAAAPSCAKSADANDDGTLNITDPIWMLLHSFAGLGALPEPFSNCGTDATNDGLSCRDYTACP